MVLNNKLETVGAYRTKGVCLSLLPFFRELKSDSLATIRGKQPWFGRKLEVDRTVGFPATLALAEAEAQQSQCAGQKPILPFSILLSLRSKRVKLNKWKQKQDFSPNVALASAIVPVPSLTQ